MEERQYLRETLRGTLGELREQVYHAEAPAFKDFLKHQKMLLEGVLAKLELAESA